MSTDIVARSEHELTLDIGGKQLIVSKDLARELGAGLVRMATDPNFAGASWPQDAHDLSTEWQLIHKFPSGTRYFKYTRSDCVMVAPSYSRFPFRTDDGEQQLDISGNQEIISPVSHEVNWELPLLGTTSEKMFVHVGEALWIARHFNLGIRMLPPDCSDPVEHYKVQ